MNKRLASSATRRVNGQRATKHINGNASGRIDSEFATEISGQARRMTSQLLSLTRRLLAVDDQTSELPLRQLRVCMSLYEAPKSMSALGRELGVSLSAMTQIADRLERAGLVRRMFEGNDRRVRSLQLTLQGQKIMKVREETRIGRVSQVVERMPASVRHEVLNSLDLLLTASTLQS